MGAFLLLTVTATEQQHIVPSESCPTSQSADLILRPHPSAEWILSQPNYLADPRRFICQPDQVKPSPGWETTKEDIRRSRWLQNGRSGHQ